jgi:hypothetical protein
MQRTEDAALQELVEPLSRRGFDDPRENVDSPAVLPNLAGLVRQGQLAEAGREVGQRLVAGKHALLAIKPVDLHIAVLGWIDQAGRVAEQISHDHRALLRRKREFRLPSRRIRLLGCDFHVLEFRQVLGDRRIEVELPLVDQNHRGHAGDRFGHRCDPENRIRLHWNRLAAVLKADRLEVGELAAPGDRHHGARQVTGVNPRLIPRRDAREPRRRETQTLRIARCRQIVSERRCRQGQGRRDHACHMDEVHRTPARCSLVSFLPAGEVR